MGCPTPAAFYILDAGAHSLILLSQETLSNHLKSVTLCVCGLCILLGCLSCSLPTSCPFFAMNNWKLTIVTKSKKPSVMVFQGIFLCVALHLGVTSHSKEWHTKPPCLCIAELACHTDDRRPIWFNWHLNLKLLMEPGKTLLLEAVPPPRCRQISDLSGHMQLPWSPWLWISKQPCGAHEEN